MSEQNKALPIVFPRQTTIYRGEGDELALPLSSSLISEYGNVFLTMQEDGNLVIKFLTLAIGIPEKTLWSTKTKKIKDGLYFKSDGNLVLNDTDGNQVWESGTAGKGVERFTIEVDGNFVGYSKDDKVIWQTHSAMGTEGLIYKPSPSIIRGLTFSGIALPLGRSITSENKKAVLEMQRDGNLVVYSIPNQLEPLRRPIWSSKTNGIKIKEGLFFQSDGNLVLYNLEGKPVWASNTNGTEVDKFTLENDGNFVGYGKHGTVFWQSDSKAGELKRCDPSQFLPVGLDLISENGLVRLSMQDDGNLVIYCEPDHKAIWSTKTNGQKIKDGLTFQFSDGNLCLYDTEGKCVWATMTNGTEVDKFVIQNDGNFVGYGKHGTVYWQSGSKCPC